MFIILTVILALLVTPAFSKDVPAWVTNALNSQYTQLSDETDAILLLSDTELSYDNEKIKAQNKLLYKINHLKGIKYGSLHVSGDKQTRVSRVKGYRMNSSGELIEELKRENIVRRAYNEDFFDDAEQLFANFERVEIGDIIAFEYDTRSEPFFKQSTYWMGDHIEIAVKRVHVPENSLCHVMNDPDNKVQFSGRTYEITNQPAVESEFRDPSLLERIPVVGIMFDTPELGTWKSFSAKYWKKTQGGDILNDVSLADLNHLLSISNRAQFIRKTLEHVSNAVAYLDIEVGDGKFIPTDCNIVHEKKYGDCKDMANYALAILHKGGVKAIPVLARTRRAGPVFESFPGSQFNHMIIGVELGPDTLALKNIEIRGKPYLIADLTDKYTIPPMVPESLESTWLLPMTEEGDELCQMPVSNPDTNVKEYKVKLKYHHNRSVTGEITETLYGHYCANEKMLLGSKDEQEKDKMYRDWLQDLIPGSVLAGVTVDQENSEKFSTTAQFSASNIGTDINKELFVGPNIVDSTHKSYRKRKRDCDLLYNFPYTRKIHVEMEVDPVFRIVKVPELQSFENEHFNFSSSISVQGQVITFDCTFLLKKRRITTDEYTVFRKAYKKYLKNAKAQVALKEKI